MRVYDNRERIGFKTKGIPNICKKCRYVVDNKVFCLVWKKEGYKKAKNCETFIHYKD